MNKTRAATAFFAILLLTASCSSSTNRSTHTSPSRLNRRALEARLTALGPPATAAVGDEALLEGETVAAFYAAHKGEPAWDLPAGAESMRQAIADIAHDGLNPADYHLAKIDALLAARKQQRADSLDADLEILLSDAAAAMIDNVRYGRVRPAALDPRWNVDPRKGAPPLGEALARVAEAASPADGIANEKLDHFIYKGLKAELARLETAAAAGGWAAIPRGSALAEGANDARIPLVRRRLAATGELPDAAPGADSTAYDGALETAVHLFQERHRLVADGKINAQTLEAMNVPAADRAAQVKVNLERSRWVLPGLQGDFMLVNLPAFKTYLIRGDKNVWESRTQIGKEARQTPSFRANMQFVIFNPTWTVPSTILREDVLAGINRGEDMIAKKHLKVLDRSGKEVDPGSVDWKAANAGSFPYTLRQDAGPNNALGRVKFMFPNPYDIYLHDTPSRELFGAEKRTFSSGCIRVENPLELAAVLLADKGYDAAKIEQTIADGKTQQVNLSAPLPILIVYWTVSVGASGEVRYAPDVYGLDPAVLQALGNPPS
jgi:murein L,D-transpeptidase YcbB/YkuD